MQVFLHLVHFYKLRFPCNYDILLNFTPDLKCNPSVFWDTKYLNIYLSKSVLIAICVKDGSAQSTILSILSLGGIYYLFLFQIPGPVGTIVLEPERKSGIPMTVEQPAPVKKMGYLAFFIRVDKVLTLDNICQGDSIHSLTVVCKNWFLKIIIIIIIVIREKKMTESYNEAITNLNNENFQIAVDGFNKSIAAGINILSSLKLRSQTLFYSNKYQSAIQSYQQLIDRFPDCQDGYIGKALSLVMQGQNNDVQKLYQKAIQTNPKNWKIYFTHGFILLKQRKFDDSLAMFEQAITKNSLNDPICYIAQAEAFYQKKKNQQARKSMKYAKKALNDSSNHKLLYQFQIKKLYESLDQYQQDIQNLINLENDNKIKPSIRIDVESSLTKQLCISLMTNNPVIFRQFSQKMSNVSTDSNLITNISGEIIQVQKQKQSTICQCKFCRIF